MPESTADRKLVRLGSVSLGTLLTWAHTEADAIGGRNQRYRQGFCVRSVRLAVRGRNKIGLCVQYWPSTRR